MLQGETLLLNYIFPVNIFKAILYCYLLSRETWQTSVGSDQETIHAVVCSSPLLILFHLTMFRKSSAIPSPFFVIAYHIQTIVWAFQEKWKKIEGHEIREMYLEF